MATLNARLREGTGKSVTRKLRAAGQVPAVAYGHGEAPRTLTVDALELQNLLAGINPENTILELRVEGAKPVQVLIREIQQHPIRPEVEHLDFYQVRAGETLQVSIPVQLHGVPVGVRNSGGILQEVTREILIESLPAEIPTSIDLNVDDLDIGGIIYVSDLDLPHLTILTDPEQVICTVSAPAVTALPEEEEAEAEAEEAAEAEGSEEGS